MKILTIVWPPAIILYSISITLYESKQMKKLLLLAASLVFSAGAWASPTCDKIAKVAQANASNYGDEATALIQGKKGSRNYFYTAPSNQCRSKAFIIPNDKVLILQDILSNGESWAYVSFVNNKTSQITQGWIKKNSLGEMIFN